MREYCKIAVKYGSTLPNFPIRVGSIYGQNSGRLFVVEHAETFRFGVLTCFVSRDSGKHWNVETVSNDNKIFKAVYECIRTQNGGKIPVCGTFKDPQAHGRIVGKPVDRNPQRHYMRYDNTYRFLRKHNADNADFGGGGDAVMLPIQRTKRGLYEVEAPITKLPCKWQKPTYMKKDTSAHDGMMHDVSGRRIK